MAMFHLITGGSGYLAHSLARRLDAGGARIRRLIRSGSPAPEYRSPAVEDFTGSASSRDDLERAMEGVDVVHHLAAQTSVYKANEDPFADLQANAVALLNILETARAGGRRPLILMAGTVTQTGFPERLPVDESHPDKPLTVYCMHKLLAEHYVEHYARSGWVRGAALRLANVYGPGPKSSSADRGILNLMIRRALAGEDLKIYGQGDWQRDYVYVEDVAAAFAAASACPDAVSGRHFVVSYGVGHPFARAVSLVADLVATRTGRRVRVEHVEPPAGLSPIETRNFVGDPSALMAATGWKPAVTLEEGINRTIDYYMESKDPK